MIAARFRLEERTDGTKCLGGSAVQDIQRGAIVIVERDPKDSGQWVLRVIQGANHVTDPETNLLF